MNEEEALERIFQLMNVPAGQYDMLMKRVSINDEGFTFTMWAEDVDEEDASTYTMRWAKVDQIDLIELTGVAEKPILVSPNPTVIFAILYAT